LKLKRYNYINILMINRKINLSVVAGIIVVLVTSCLSTEKFEKEEVLRIQSYLSAHSDISFGLKSSGLYYADIVVGTGAHPVTNDTAYIMYTGTYLTETIFSTNIGTTDTLISPVGVGNLLSGFDEAITYMNAGGKSKIVVPSELGYGNTGWYFPAYTPLVYDIYLVRIKPGPGAR
jgi:FKBP-type peptidyl-prolyl cis-trans isomerase